MPQRITLASYPQGVPEPENFQLEEFDLPAPGAGEVLCRTRYLSLDPYMRSQMAGRHLSGALSPGDTMRGEAVSEIVESRVRWPGAGSTGALYGGVAVPLDPPGGFPVTPLAG